MKGDKEIMITDKTERRTYKIPFYDGHSEANGRSTMYVTCPFCNLRIQVYIWSFYGCGRRCDCGALLLRLRAYKEIK